MPTNGNNKNAKRGKMESILQTLRGMGPAKLAALAFTGIILMIVLFLVTAHLTAPSMVPVYTDLSLDDSAKIVSELDKSGTQYELRANGTEVLVPSDQVLRLRLSLAQAGLPTGGSMVGYEIFDRSETLGTSTSVLNINMLRALEGELSRTIASLTQVESARVHLVIPKQELFSRDKQEPTASVVLKLRGSAELSKEEIGAITHLVATAVPGLKAASITLVDTRGRMLAGGGGEDNDSSSLAASAAEQKLAYEMHLKSVLENLVEKSVGAGKVKVTVNADIDFDRVVTNSETYDPNGQVARSVQTGEEKEQSNEREGRENTSAANNLPNAQANSTGNGSNRIVDKTDETTNYEISKTVENHIKETGKVNKVTVAVLVDGTYTADKDGKQTYAPRSDDERKQIDTLVKSAIGYDEKRGDKVDIVNMRFIAPEEEPADHFIWFKENARMLIQTVVFGAVGILFILMILRPVMTRLLEGGLLSAGGGAIQTGGPVLAAAGGAPAFGGDDAAPAATTGAAEPGVEEPSVDISRVTGRVKSSTVSKLNELVEKNPGEALGVLRQWAARKA